MVNSIMLRTFTSIMVSLYLLCLAPQIWATDLSTAKADFAQGRYEQVISELADINELDALLLTSKALNAQLLLGLSTDEKATSQRALETADQARRVDPASSEAQFSYATAYALYGRTVSPIKAWRKKLPQTIEAEIEKAIHMGSERADAYALLGSWHIGVMHKAGARTAKKSFGADFETGVGFFNRALGMAPDDIVINANAGMMFLIADPGGYHELAKQKLQRAVAGTPDDYLQSQIQNRAKAILTNWENPKAARKIANEFLNW